MTRLFRWLNKWGMERFFEVDYDEGRFAYRRNAEQIGRYSRLDGCYVVKSNVPAGGMNEQELALRYKDLKHVEQAFRTMKTTELTQVPQFAP